MDAIVLGVDGAGRGWVAADPRTRTLTYVDTLLKLPVAAVVAIDIPLGFPPCGERRPAEAAAAELVKGRSSVFLTQCEPVYRLDTSGLSSKKAYAAARKSAETLSGSSISAQAWALRDKILLAQRYCQQAAGTVIEVHPEVAFTTMHRGRPLQYTKKTWLGTRERAALLASCGHDPETYTGDTGPAGVDDVLDAMAAAWVAERHHQGRARPLADPRPPDVPIWT